MARIEAFNEEEARECIKEVLDEFPDFPHKALMGKIVEKSDRNIHPEMAIKILEEYGKRNIPEI